MKVAATFEAAGGSPRPVMRGSDVAPGVAELAYADGAQAVTVVRDRAADWAVDPNKIGFIGFSAGPYVTTAVATTADPRGRADFVAPIYGGSVEAPLDEHTPPMFCAVAADDALVLEPCLTTFEAWRAAGRPAEIHVYGEGGHGFGTKQLGLPVDSWLDRLGDWMTSLGYMN
jgi:acetyl esterase/lipase